MSYIITAASLKVAKSRASLCVALSDALEEFDAVATEKSQKGRKAMEKVGGVLLKRLQKVQKTPAPFASVEGMLSFVNMSKQASEAALVALAVKGATLDTECEYAYLRKLHSKTIEACVEFAEAWQARKAA